MFENEESIIRHLQQSFHISKTRHHSHNFKREAAIGNKSVFLEHFGNQQIIALIHRALRAFLNINRNPQGRYVFDYLVPEQQLGWRYSMVNGTITHGLTTNEL